MPTSHISTLCRSVQSDMRSTQISSSSCRAAASMIHRAARAVPLRRHLAARTPCAAAAPVTGQLIDGKATAATIRKEIKAQVERMKAENNLTPGLAVVLVGSRKDSQAYVNSKKKACEEVGFNSYGTDLPEDATEEEVLKVGCGQWVARVTTSTHGRCVRTHACMHAWPMLLEDCHTTSAACMHAHEMWLLPLSRQRSEQTQLGDHLWFGDVYGPGTLLPSAAQNLTRQM